MSGEYTAGPRRFLFSNSRFRPCCPTFPSAVLPLPSLPFSLPISRLLSLHLSLPLPTSLSFSPSLPPPGSPPASPPIWLSLPSPRSLGVGALQRPCVSYAPRRTTPRTSPRFVASRLQQTRCTCMCVYVYMYIYIYIYIYTYAYAYAYAYVCVCVCVRARRCARAHAGVRRESDISYITLYYIVLHCIMLYYSVL